MVHRTDIGRGEAKVGGGRGGKVGLAGVESIVPATLDTPAVRDPSLLIGHNLRKIRVGGA